MDNVTHSLAGLMMSRAGLNRWCPRATVILLLAANLPDVDFAGAAGGDLMILEWHRGPTHSILFSPLVALAPLAILALFARKNMNWRRAYFVSWAGVASHFLLDWTNMYGVRLLSPVNEDWYALNINSVMDFWIWALFLLAVAWTALSRLVTSEIGASRASGRGPAIFALAALVVFDFGRYVLHERANNVLDSRVYAGEAPERVEALPTMANPFRWRGIVETRSAYLLFDVNLLDRQFDPSAARTLYKPEVSDVVRRAMETEPFRKFLWFAKFPLWQVAPAELRDGDGATKAQVLDLRFALPGEDAFAATAILDARGQIVRSWFQYEAPGAPPRFR